MKLTDSILAFDALGAGVMLLRKIQGKGFEQDWENPGARDRKLVAIAQRLADKRNIPKEDRPDFTEMSEVQIQWWIELVQGGE